MISPDKKHKRIEVRKKQSDVCTTPELYSSNTSAQVSPDCFPRCCAWHETRSSLVYHHMPTHYSEKQSIVRLWVQRIYNPISISFYQRKSLREVKLTRLSGRGQGTHVAFVKAKHRHEWHDSSKRKEKKLTVTMKGTVLHISSRKPGVRICCRMLP